MGFEEVIPPVPDRLTELQGISKLEESWLSQPYYKYYMNESLRQPKLAYAERINKTYREFWQNLALVTVAIIPFTILAKRFFVTRSGLPVTYKPDYFQKYRTDTYIRQTRYLKVMVPVHAIASVSLAFALTNWQNLFCDKKYEFLHKTPVMM